MSNVMVAGRHSWHDFLNDDGDVSCWLGVLRAIVVNSILHDDGGDGDVGTVGGLKAFVV